MDKFTGNSFNEIYDYTENMSKKKKGDLFEEFTYHLFKLDPRLNGNLESIWPYSNIPDKILTQLKLPSKDKGIDLLAIINGEFYAIQCKFRQDPRKTITWTELSTFFGLSFGMNNKIKGGFLVTNTLDLCDEVINSLKVQPIYGDFFDNLSLRFFECIRKNRIRGSYSKKKPLQHQRLCILNAELHYLDFDRGYISMACGTGKTLTSYWINNKLFNKKTVIFVPSLYLLSQFYSDWVNQSYAEKNKIHYILIGSDADVDEEIKYKSNGLILNTDPKSIRQYIKSIAPQDKLVVISTYQSADKLAEACRGIEFDFSIFDEAHKTVGQADKKFNLMLTNKYLQIKKRMFMTATPKIYNGDLDAEDIISMDNKNIYGHNVFTYDTSEAIRDKRLVDYQVISLYAKNADIVKAIKTNKLVKFQDEFDADANYVGIIIILLKKIHDNTCKHLITYHNKVSSARKFAEILETINNLLYNDEILVGHLNGSTSMTKRTKIIKDFALSKKAILCSARVLNEGVNIPVVDSVCFVDPRFSTIDIIQCIGRSLRLHEGKNMAHIIVPIFINNFEDNFDKDAHGNVIRILKSLKNTDSGVIEYFKMRANGNYGGRKIVVNEFFEEKYCKEIDLDEWNTMISGNIWKVTDSFECMYEKVKQWIEENNGKIPSMMSKNQIEKGLGYWCSDKRKFYKKGKLSQDTIMKLESISTWYWKIDTFNKQLRELKNWVENNDGKIPSAHASDTIEKNLGSWCNNKRIGYKKGILSKEKIDELEHITTWYWKREDTFYERYEEVENWVNENGKIPSAKSKNQVEKSLGTWCSNKRKNYRIGILTEKQISDLNKIKHWYWPDDTVKEVKTFDATFAELKEFVEKNGRIPTYGSKDLVEKNLGAWCTSRRMNYKKGTLTKEKIKKLEQLPGWYWPKLNTKRVTQTFDERFDDLKKWVDSNNGKIPSYGSDDKIEKRLGQWCGTLRSKYKDNNLSADQINKIKTIKSWYWVGNSKQSAGSKSNKYKKSRKKNIKAQK